jgi:hypothetical protein
MSTTVKNAHRLTNKKPKRTGKFGPEKGALPPIKERIYRSPTASFTIVGTAGGWMGATLTRMSKNGRGDYTMAKLTEAITALNRKHALAVKLSLWKNGAVGAARHLTRVMLQRGIVKVKKRG